MNRIIISLLLIVPLAGASVIKTSACDRGNCCDVTINDRDNSYRMSCNRPNTDVRLTVSDPRGRHMFTQSLQRSGRLDRSVTARHSFKMDVRSGGSGHQKTVVVKEQPRRNEVIVVKEQPRRNEVVVVKENRGGRRSGSPSFHYEEPDCYDIGSGRFSIQYQTGEVLVEGRCHRRDRDGEFLFYNDFGDVWMRVNYNRDRAERIECRDRRGHWRNVRSEDDCFNDYGVRTIRRRSRR